MFYKHQEKATVNDNHEKNSDLSADQVVGKAAKASRRSILKLGLASAPVVATLATRSAFGQGAPNWSAGVSANLASGAEARMPVGHTPSYWQGLILANSNLPMGKSGVQYQKTDSFLAVMGVAGGNRAWTNPLDHTNRTPAFPHGGDVNLVTLADVFGPGGTNLFTSTADVAAYAAAALLSAAEGEANPGFAYQLSEAGVRTIFNRRFVHGTSWADIAAYFSSFQDDYAGAGIGG